MIFDEDYDESEDEDEATMDGTKLAKDMNAMKVDDKMQSEGAGVEHYADKMDIDEA
jgi:hypothetical protein